MWPRLVILILLCANYTLIISYLRVLQLQGHVKTVYGASKTAFVESQESKSKALEGAPYPRDITTRKIRSNDT
jgi:hypothetical protein